MEDQLTFSRLRNQRIAGSDFRDAAEVVRWMGAMQAQDYAGAVWSIGLRMPNAVEGDVLTAIAQRRIVRTWPMRGTLHFIPTEDVRWMLRYLTPRVLAGAVRRHEELALDGKTLRRAEKVWRHALVGGRSLTRTDMLQTLAQAGIAMDPSRGYYTLWRLAQEAVICFGPRAGKEPTFVLLDEWAPPAGDRRIDSREEALAALAARYFRSHGPATVHDFAWWSGVTMADARAGLDASAGELEKISLGGLDYWASVDRWKSPRVEQDVFLLSGFDEYMLGYQDRSASLASGFAARIVPGGNGVFLPTLVQRGQVVGTWKRSATKKRVVITAAPFKKLSKAAVRQLEAAAAAYGRFAGLPGSAMVAE